MNNKKTKEITIRSSTAEYLTFVSATGGDKSSVEMRYENENIWLTQKLLSVLYDVDVANINQHIKKIYTDNELTENATIKNFLIVQNEGNRQIEREIKHYNLQMIVAIGFKVNNERAVQFRKWANKIVKDFTIQGWVMDEERLKNNGSILTKEYFEKQLQKIREIRLSERKFYQKITDIYATALDYDNTAKTTQDFFANVQNKMHYAIHNNTAAELVVKRANSKKENMGLATWQDAPNGKIQKFDVVVAKNYLSEPELKNLARIVSMYLDYAELQAERKMPMTMQDWATRLNEFLKFNRQDILENFGTVSADVAKCFAETEFEKFRIRQDQLFESDFDKLTKKLAKKNGGESDE